MKTIAKFGAAVLLIAPAFAQSAQQTRTYNEGGNWVEEIAGSLGNARNLHIQIESGSVKVTGGSQNGISYVIHNQAMGATEDKARRAFESYKIVANVRGDTAWITAEWENGRPHRFSGEFVIQVPREMDSAKIETEGGSITAEGLSGKMEAESGGGGIHLSDIGGYVKAETGGGNIDVARAGSDVSLETGGGTIHVSEAQGKVHAESGGGSIVLASGQQDAVLETGAGSIHVDHCLGKVTASTGGGSIDLGDIGGPVVLDTGGGSIRLASAKGTVHAETGGGSIELNGSTSVHAETGSGSIVARLVPGGDGSDSSLETSAGDITVYINPAVHIMVRASIESPGGFSIHSDFPEIGVRSESSEWGPRNVSAEGSLNGGGATLKIQTTSGNIYIRRSQ